MEGRERGERPKTDVRIRKRSARPLESSRLPEPSPPPAAAPPEAGQERPVFGASETLLEDPEDGWQVAPDQRAVIEPEPGKDPALPDALRAGRERPVLAAAELEPVDLAVEHAPDEVFEHPASPVSGELRVEVVARAGGRDLGDKLRGSLDIVVLRDPRPASVVGEDEEADIRLWLVVQVEAHGRVAAQIDPWRPQVVGTEPEMQIPMRLSVLALLDRRGQVHHPFNQLGLLQLRHGVVPALELVPAQPVSVLEGRNGRRGSSLPRRPRDDLSHASHFLSDQHTPRCRSGHLPTRDESRSPRAPWTANHLPRSFHREVTKWKAGNAASVRKRTSASGSGRRGRWRVHGSRNRHRRRRPRRPRRARNARCSGLRRPFSRTLRTAGRSLRISERSSSQSPGKTRLFRMPFGPAGSGRYSPRRSSNQSISRSSTRQTRYSSTPLRR